MAKSIQERLVVLERSIRGLCCNLAAIESTPGPQGPQGDTGPQGPQGIQGATGPSASITSELNSRIERETLYSDFTHNNVIQGPFLGTILATGAAVITTQNTDNRFGAVLMQSSATLSSGYRYITGNGLFQFDTNILSGSQLDCVFIFELTSGNNSTTRIGFMDTINASDASNGAYFELINNGTTLAISAKTARSGVRTSVSLGSLSTGQLTHFRVIFNNTNLFTFEVYAQNGTLINSTTINTNLPNLNSAIGCGLITTSNTAVAQSLGIIDYLGITRPVLNRGALT